MNKDESVLIGSFTFPEVEVRAHWNELQLYASQSHLEIEWDSSQQILVAVGKRLDPQQFIAGISAILFGKDSLDSDLYWDGNWLCTLVFAKTVRYKNSAT